MSPLLRGSVDVSPVCNIGQTFSQYGLQHPRISHADLARDWIDRENGLGVALLSHADLTIAK